MKINQIRHSYILTSIFVWDVMTQPCPNFKRSEQSLPIVWRGYNHLSVTKLDCRLATFKDLFHLAKPASGLGNGNARNCHMGSFNTYLTSMKSNTFGMETNIPGRKRRCLKDDRLCFNDILS